jgi:hypothetical protein
MIDAAEKNRLVGEILESPIFKDSGRYRDLLLYLVKETLEGNVPKEVTIASEFFRRESGFDPKEDPTVRVYLNNLRKKLEHYYLTTDKPHAYRIEIPKGHYQVEFLPVEAKPPLKKPSILPLLALITSSIAILLIGWILLRGIGQPDNAPDYGSNPLWAEFLAPAGRPTMIVLGDFFFLFERTPEGATRNFVRNVDINSLDDFKAMVKRDPAFSARYVQGGFTFLRPSASWGLSQILPVFQQSPNNVSLKLASQLTVDDLRTNNIIFLGSFKTLYSLDKILHIFGLRYAFAPNRFEVQGWGGDSARTFLPMEIKGGNYEKDYAVVTRGIGPEGGIILLLLSFSDSGVIEASRAVTDQVMVNRIVNDLAVKPPTLPFQFTLVLESEGLQQAVFKAAVRYFVQHPLPQTSPPERADSSQKTN